jgi:hypothetical protein
MKEGKGELKNPVKSRHPSSNEDPSNQHSVLPETPLVKLSTHVSKPLPEEAVPSRSIITHNSDLHMEL